jgi:long-chain acyl-CoA synthetase
MTAPAIADLIDTEWRRAAARTAVRDGDHELSFGELLTWSERVSAAVERAAAPPGSRVAMVLPNSGMFVAGFFGVARAGAVAAPLNPQAPVPELTRALSALEPAVVITTHRLLDVVEQALRPMPSPSSVLAMSHPDGVELFRAPRPSGRPLAIADSPPLLQLSTSGTTGAPKHVVRSHAALLRELTALRTALAATESDRFLGVAPFHHVNGLVRTMMLAMSVGAELHARERFQRREVLQVLTERRITVFGAVPQVFVLLAETPPRGASDLSALRMVFSASAPLTAADNALFRNRYEVFVRQLYGSTETGSVTFNADPDPGAALESVGHPLDGVRLRLVDEAGHTVRADEEGEILVASPFAASSYLDDEAESARFADGFYRTGDLGRVDATGRLRLTGRRKLLINRGGFKVNPYEVEAVLSGHPSVKEVVVFGRPTRHGDDLVSCIVVARDPCTPEEIVDHCRAWLADYKVPSRVEFRTSLPRTASGKVRRDALAEA